VVHHPWLTILAWVVAAVAVIATSPGLPTTTNESSFLPKSYESIRAANLQDKAFPQAGHVTRVGGHHRVLPGRWRQADPG
jgi:putative drug exporter of the RND superfamily